MKIPTPFQSSKPIKALVLRGVEHAGTLGDTTTGAEHLLLAAFDQPDGSAIRAFERTGADPRAFASAIDDAHDAALRGVGIEPIPSRLLAPSRRRSRRLGESAIHVLKTAAVRSREDRGQTLGAHVVAAVAGLEHGTAARALRTMNVDRVDLAVAADAEIAHATRSEPRR